MKEQEFHLIEESKEAEELSEIWARNLDLREVDLHTDFTSLGGHSLIATRIVVEISEKFGLNEEEQDRILSLGTLAEQVEFVQRLRR